MTSQDFATTPAVPMTTFNRLIAIVAAGFLVLGAVAEATRQAIPHMDLHLGLADLGALCLFSWVVRRGLHWLKSGVRPVGFGAIALLLAVIGEGILVGLIGGSGVPVGIMGGAIALAVSVASVYPDFSEDLRLAIKSFFLILLVAHPMLVAGLWHGEPDRTTLLCIALAIFSAMMLGSVWVDLEDAVTALSNTSAADEKVALVGQASSLVIAMGMALSFTALVYRMLP